MHFLISTNQKRNIQKTSKHNKKRQNKTTVIFKHEKIPKNQLAPLLAKKLTTKTIKPY